MKPALGLLVLCVVALQAQATNAPTNLNVNAISSSQVSMTWTDNSSDEIGFTFMVDTNPAFTNPAFVWTGGPNTTSHTHGNLNRATTYFYRIKAEGNPDSAWTSTDFTTTAPSSLAGTAASSSQINLTWSGNSANTNIVGYTVAKATNSAFTSASYHYVNGAGATSYSSTGLSAGATYYYKIKAEGTSDAYDSPFTAAITATTNGAAPAAPSNLTATVVSSSQINLSWSDNSSNETAFELKRATDSGFTQNVVWIGGIQGSSYSNTGLPASTTYYYKVRAKGTAQDSAYSAAVSATTSASTQIPAAPSGLTATAVSNSRINLIWTDHSSNETGFEVKRATDSAFTQNVTWVGGITGTAYGSTGLNPSTTYYFAVRAEGTAGKSSYSNTANATTTGTPPPAEGIPISPRFFGVNAWMPRRVGESMTYGQLANKWTEVENSRPGSIRYGGIAVDEAEPGWVEGEEAPVDLCPPDSRESTMKQYVDIVNDIRGAGAEPVLQVPVLANQRNEQQAADLVRCLNVTLEMGVKYWSIGNEPDLAYSGFGAAEIAEYIKRFSSAMKAVDPSIKIVAPETAWYNWNVIDPLTDGGTHDITGTDASGRYYVDVISFHAYPYPGKDGSGNKIWPDRAGVIGKLASFDSNLNQLKTRVAQRNSARNRTGDNAITIAVTEANVNYENPTNDSIDGVGATSFLGGQFWAEMLGIAMEHGVDFFNFWSVIEGNNVAHDKGYLCRDGVTVHPSYHHFKMMAEHFRGNALTPSDNQTNVKTFAAKDTDQVTVILINMDGTTDYTYSVSLNSTASSGSLQVNVPANISATQSTGTVSKQSTILLVFNSSGTLKKKIEYKRYGTNNNPTLTETNFP